MRLFRAVSSLVLVQSLILLSSCTKQSGGVIDPVGTPPFLTNATALPDTIKMNTLPQSNGVLTVTVSASVQVVRQNGAAALSEVNVGVFTSGATSPLLSAPLHDDGVSPDVLAGDGVYSVLLHFTILRSASGILVLRFSSADQLGLQSNTLETPIVLVRPSHLPVLSNLLAPDTVTVPVNGSTTFQVSVRVTDVDGQEDVNQVYFLSLDSSNPTQKYILNNDGTAPGSVVGDSNYALTLQVNDSPTVRKTYRFAFQAVNSLGDTTASLIHLITIR